MSALPVVRLHLYEAAFEVWAVQDSEQPPLIFLKHFPLALYVLWVTCRTTYLGNRFESLRALPWTSEYWYLAWPLSFPHAVVDHGTRRLVFCHDICLGRADFSRVLQDLAEFLQCQVLIILAHSLL